MQGARARRPSRAPPSLLGRAPGCSGTFVPRTNSLVVRCSLMTGLGAALSLKQQMPLKLSARLQAQQGAAPGQDVCARDPSRAPSSLRARSPGVAQTERTISETARKLSLSFLFSVSVLIGTAWRKSMFFPHRSVESRMLPVHKKGVLG